ncbi:VOC family protein [Streptomyces sp. NPDC050636]|uniref:VOC family protein n=1 Tax=Streptomyces sp. NPDC050636 TaxID=3154510 RepID=UPI00342FA58C
MAVPPEGAPCWADAMFTDIEGAKSFYGDVLGWTFGEASTEFGNYTEAYSGGKAVAAVVPPMPGQEGEEEKPAWCLYLASPDVVATAGRIRDNGGEVLMGPMQVGDFGSMLIARDPGGVTFGVWQAGTHQGFGKTAEPGAYCWAEVFTREPEKADAFFPAVFSYGVKRLADEAIDFTLFNLGDTPVLGRMGMTDEFPPEVSPYLNIYFAVADCDAAVAKTTERGGVLRFGPMDSPFGRFATLSDPQGAAFSVIDTKTTKGEMPKTSDVS